MVSLRLESDTDSLDLSGVELNGYGVQSLRGATGLGLPPVSVQWLEGAGDGASYRGTRVLPRDMDFPLLILGRSREELKSLLSRLAVMVSKPAKLVFVDERGDEWTTDVVRVGGGDYTYGTDTTGEDELMLVLTLRAGDPFFTSTRVQSQRISNDSAIGLLTGHSLTELRLSSAQNMGTVTLVNNGDAKAYPVWKLVGPGTNFSAVSSNGEILTWSGTLAQGETLTIDTKAGTVVDGKGANRYAGLARRPQMWAIPGGTTTADIVFNGTTPGASSVTVQWQARRWVSI